MGVHLQGAICFRYCYRWPYTGTANFHTSLVPISLVLVVGWVTTGQNVAATDPNGVKLGAVG